MPRMEDEALEDLAEKLHGCLEGGEGCLEHRALQVRRVAASRLVRSLSDSFLPCIGDLDRLGALRVGEVVRGLQEGEEAGCRRAGSSLNLGQDWGPSLAQEKHEEEEAVWVEAQGRGEEEQALALMAWAGATLAGRGGITINTQVARSCWKVHDFIACVHSELSLASRT